MIRTMHSYVKIIIRGNVESKVTIEDRATKVGGKSVVSAARQCRWLGFEICLISKHLILLAACLLCSAKLLAATHDWQKTAFIINSFNEVALGSEYGSAALTVRKWNKPIRIYVEHQVKDSQLHDELLNAHISDLQNITKLDIKRVSNSRQANIRYYFTSQKKLPALVKSVSGKSSVKYLRNSVCMATMRANHSGSISSAVVYIPVDQARMHAKLVSCIVEELTQVLGLPRDSDEVFPSIFNDHSFNDGLTGLDIVLLKILYHRQIKSGMRQGKLRPVLTHIINKMRNKGEINRSAKLARTLALCAYIDC